MTLDEAIRHCEEVAEQNETQAEKIGRQFIGSAIDKYATACRECAADHRQLAEWLAEQKELRNSIGAVKLSNMKEALELIREYKVENIAQKKLIAEYKRLLKSATNVLKIFIPCDDDYCSECMKQRQNCEYDDSFKWLYIDEALKLIGGETDEQI